MHPKIRSLNDTHSVKMLPCSVSICQSTPSNSTALANSSSTAGQGVAIAIRKRQSLPKDQRLVAWERASGAIETIAAISLQASLAISWQRDDRAAYPSVSRRPSACFQAPACLRLSRRLSVSSSCTQVMSEASKPLHFAHRLENMAMAWPLSAVRRPPAARSANA